MRRIEVTLALAAMLLGGVAVPAMAQRVPVARQMTASLFVNAATPPPGLDTGIDVRPGSTVEVAGSGTAFYGTDYCTPTDDYPSTDPNGDRPGCGRKVDPHATDPSAPIGELLAKTGCDPSYTAVGTGGEFQSVEGGELYLLYNDSFYPDNVGGYTADITILPPPPHYTATATCNHYDVQMEGWIPQRRVVDPVYPIAQHFIPGVPNPYAADVLANDPPECLSGASLDLADKYYRVTSFYSGDGHDSYGSGTYRVAKEVSFDSDGTNIFNFVPSTALPPVGMSQRTHTIDDVTDHSTSTCTDTATGRDNAGPPASTGNSFTMGYQTANPLAPPLLTPSIKGTITGSVDAAGDLGLTFTHTLFPSHGLRVTINGAVALRGVVNDVSCLSQPEVLGIGGAARLLYGLNTLDSDSLVAVPGRDTRIDIPSDECTLSLP